MYLTDFFTDQALSYITDQANANPDQPWFLYMSCTAPHAPMVAKELDLKRVPLASLFGGDYSSSVAYKILGTDGVVTAGTPGDRQ